MRVYIGLQGGGKVSKDNVQKLDHGFSLTCFEGCNFDVVILLFLPW